MITVIRTCRRKTEIGESGEGKERKKKNEYHNEENLKRTNENKKEKIKLEEANI